MGTRSREASLQSTDSLFSSHVHRIGHKACPDDELGSIAEIKIPEIRTTLWENNDGMQVILRFDVIIFMSVWQENAQLIVFPETIQWLLTVLKGDEMCKIFHLFWWPLTRTDNEDVLLFLLRFRGKSLTFNWDHPSFRVWLSKHTYNSETLFLSILFFASAHFWRWGWKK